MRVGAGFRHTRRVTREIPPPELPASRPLSDLIAEEPPTAGGEFLQVDWTVCAPVRPGDEITAEARVVAAREGRPISRIAATLTNRDGEIVPQGTALVHRPAARPRPAVPDRA